MDEARSLTAQLSDAASEFWTTTGDYLPRILGVLLLLILALVAAKVASALVERVLRLARVDKIAKNKTVAKTLKSAEVSIDVVSLTGRIVFWVIIIIFALTIADVLGLTAMRDVIRDLLDYLPNVLAAAIVLTVTIAGARLLRDVVAASLARIRVDYAHNVSAVVFYVVLLFGAITALDQLGIDTTFLTANITVIVGGIVLALALAFGLGGREVAGRIVEDAYANYKKSIHKR